MDLRSPHNGHIEVLARAGVPGLVLWVLLQVAFAVVDARGRRARPVRDGRRFWVQVIGWLFVLWLAGLANATFDPYLQGPQGGIWFWSVDGPRARRDPRRPRRRPRPVGGPGR